MAKNFGNVFQRFIYETERFNGVAKLLKVLGSTIDGFALPVKAEHKQFLVKVLLPLHKPECFEHYHAQRTYCLHKFVGKNATLAEEVVKGLLMFWPKICSEKEFRFLQDIENILYVAAPTQFAKIKDALFTQVAKCLCNPQCYVAERALYLWKNDYILSLIKEQQPDGDVADIPGDVLRF
ncbi:hypothetical protein HPB48_012019 [Haemaphysalis longicornis]|uniref:Uncharacterized protein n=1 Tax=Haemaphysalis longicornis TaxID=44386 RepID=A0A9J6G8S6_HAELO|nr:hypothetical protein HPB48_012019 [Haemaphysalis longicornis]